MKIYASRRQKTLIDFAGTDLWIPVIFNNGVDKGYAHVLEANAESSLVGVNIIRQAYIDHLDVYATNLRKLLNSWRNEFLAGLTPVPTPLNEFVLDPSRGVYTTDELYDMIKEYER